MSLLLIFNSIFFSNSIHVHDCKIISLGFSHLLKWEETSLDFGKKYC
jgi:hypothetical protein